MFCSFGSHRTKKSCERLQDTLFKMINVSKSKRYDTKVHKIETESNQSLESGIVMHLRKFPERSS